MLAAVPLTAIRILRPIPGCWLPLPPSALDAAVLNNGQPLDPVTLCNEFDRTRAVLDLKSQLESAGFTDISIVPVALPTVVEVAECLEREMKDKQGEQVQLVVFQLCDGTELDGYPGVSMIRELENRRIPFTGSDSVFYIMSSSKPILKRELQAANVPTSTFQEFATTPTMTDLTNIISEVGFPMIVKPSISYASRNITTSSVVHTPEQLLEQINSSLTSSLATTKSSDRQSQNVYQLWKGSNSQTEMELQHVDIETPTVFVEKFLAGHEFTALVVGDKEWGVKVYPVVERVFDPKLGKFERLLAFDQYWDGYDLQGSSGNGGFCQYQMASEAWQEQLKLVSKDAYLALGGSGYGRVDIRTPDMGKREPIVLEVNANCGLSFEKANILIISNVSPAGFVLDLVDHALHHHKRLRGSSPDSQTHNPIVIRLTNLAGVDVGHNEVLVQNEVQSPSFRVAN